MPWLLLGVLGLGALYMYSGPTDARSTSRTRDPSRRARPTVAGARMVEVSARWLQERLNVWGASLVVDGVVGTQTRDALASFVASLSAPAGTVYDASEPRPGRVEMTRALEDALAAVPAAPSSDEPSGDPSEVFRS